LIVVDTSALVEIAIGGPRALECRRALQEADTLLISAGTVTETLIVATGRAVEPHMTALLDRFGMTIVPLTGDRAKAAARAYRRYGKSWHPASLNFGDCFAYALAKEHGCPLLFVGRDFALTDVTPALTSVDRPSD
jgi:ribonuclease VapC